MTTDKHNLHKEFLPGNLTNDQMELRFQQAVARSLMLAESPTYQRSATGKRYYQTAVNVPGGCLTVMDKLRSDDLHGYINRFGVSKPKLKAAIRKLEHLRDSVPIGTQEKGANYDLMRAAHAAMNKTLDSKRRRAAKERILPFKKPPISEPG